MNGADALPSERVNPIFVHSHLDDYGLTPSQFRVYAHLSRRASKTGKAWPSIQSVARVCRLHPRTVRCALKILVWYRMVRAEPRRGGSTIYSMSPPSHWCPPLHADGDPAQTDTHASGCLASPDKPIQLHHSQGDADKVNPVEGNKLKEIQSPIIPQRGKCVEGAVEFSASQVEAIYEAYPKKIGKPAALRAIRRALTRFGPEFLLERTKLYAATYNGPQRFIPNPAKWFREERFNDDPATWRRADAPQTRPGNKAAPPRQFDRNDYKQCLTNL